LAQHSDHSESFLPSVLQVVTQFSNSTVHNLLSGFMLKQAVFLALQQLMHFCTRIGGSAIEAEEEKIRKHNRTVQ